MISTSTFRISDKLPSIKVEEDLGTFCWTPSGSQKQMNQIHVSDLDACLKADSLPPYLDMSVQLPQRLFNNEKGEIPKQRIPNSFPYDVPRIVPMAVAQDRGLDLTKVDFLCGGSMLEFLAERKSNKNNYLVVDAARHLMEVRHDATA